MSHGVRVGRGEVYRSSRNEPEPHASCGLNLAQAGENVILESDPMKIRMRPHAGRYEDEMTRAVYIDEAADVLAYIHCFHAGRRPAMRDIAQRYFGLDARNGWHSWLITLRSSPILWTDKEVPGIQLLEPVAEAGT